MENKSMGHKPTPQQSAIFDQVKDPEGGNIVVIARAGTGKTTTILSALRYTSGVVKIVAFNGRIAKELQSRVPSHVSAQTLHALGRSIVFANWNLHPQQGVDKDRCAKILKRILPSSVKFEDHVLLKKIVAKAKNLALDDTDQIEEMIVEDDMLSQNLATGVMAEYALEVMAASMQRDGTIDFDDMIWLPMVMKWTPPQIDWIFVDEAQDMNKPQLWMCVESIKSRGRICVIGDDRQAIYGFRGADTDALARMHKELSAKLLKLTYTFRCGKLIVNEANRWVGDLEAAPQNPDGIVRHIGSEKMDPKYGDFILSRTNAPLMAMALRFIRDGKRVKVVGRDIGNNFTSFINKFRVQTVAELIEKMEDYREKELRKLNRAGASDSAIDALYDKIETVVALADGLEYVNEVVQRIERLFADDNDLDPNCCLIFSSVHKAKGLEANRVFLLWDTFRETGRKGAKSSLEEQNICYVGVTRAKNELIYVSR